jgi:hypothetical protein
MTSVALKVASLRFDDHKLAASTFFLITLTEGHCSAMLESYKFRCRTGPRSLKGSRSSVPRKLSVKELTIPSILKSQVRNV